MLFFQYFSVIMSTFKKGKDFKGKFNTNELANAVKDVMHHHNSLRKEGRRWNVNFCALSRYVKQAKTKGKNFTITKKSMQTKQVCIKKFLY